MDLQERRERAVLGRLAGKSAAEVGRELGVSREMVRRYVSEAAGQRRVSLALGSIEGFEHVTREEIAAALRQYLDSLGLWHPDREDNAPPD